MGGVTYLQSLIYTLKKIISYTFSKQMTVDCTIQTLDQAKLQYHSPEGMIQHTDLGSQYTTRDVEHWLETNKISHSYSRKGRSYDNAGIESFHASLKKYTQLIIKILKKQIDHYLATLKDFITEIESID